MEILREKSYLREFTHENNPAFISVTLLGKTHLESKVIIYSEILACGFKLYITAL